MKRKIQPTNEELFLPEGEVIISKTDTKGRITYGNETLVTITGFQEAELLNIQHNIVRHPDMPRGIFHLLWETIKSGDEFNGYVKNLCKSGAFYWVFANVTPSYDTENNLLGYYSVRRRAKKEAINVIQALYSDMLTAEKNAGVKNAIAASQEILNNTINNKGMSYDEFIFSI